MYLVLTVSGINRETETERKQNMSRKHFEVIAEAIKNSASSLRDTPEHTDAIGCVARSLAAVFADENPRFDRARFLAACGVNGGAR